MAQSLLTWTVLSCAACMNSTLCLSRYRGVDKHGSGQALEQV